MASQKKYAGFTGIQWVVLIIAGVALLSLAGVGPLADNVSSFETNPSDKDTVKTGALSLDSSFVSLVSATNTLANADTNFNEDTNTVNMQVNAIASYDGTTETTFSILSKDVDGVVQVLHSFTEAGDLSVPTTDQTVEVTTTVNSAVLSGFSDTNQVEYSKVKASANRLIDTNGDYYYPFATRTGSTTVPEVKVDGTLDEKSYSWVATSAAVDHSITFKLSWAGINEMKDISDKGIVTMNIDNADDTPIVIEMIRNSALTA